MQFCPIPKIENSEISEICLFLQILTVVINQDLKSTKIWTERKTERFRYDLKEKIKMSEVSEFSILLYTQNRKLGNLGECYFTSTFSSIWNPRSKNHKKTRDKRNITLWCGLIRKYENFRGFRVFDLALRTKLKTRKSQKVFVCFKFWLVWLHLASESSKLSLNFKRMDIVFTNTKK